jgi:hypothetical protein
MQKQSIPNAYNKSIQERIHLQDCEERDKIIKKYNLLQIFIPDEFEDIHTTCTFNIYKKQQIMKMRRNP